MAIGKVAAEQTRKSKTSLKDDLRKEMFESNEKKLSAQYYKKVLLSGENGAGKTSLAMYLLLHNIQDDEMIFYINVDGSGPEIADNFYKSYYDSRQLRIIDASVFEENEKGVEIKNEEQTVNRVITAAALIREGLEEGYKIKGVIVDGLSFMLSYAEAKMRLDRNLEVDEGAQFTIWKLRNKFFRDFSSADMNLHVPVIFVSHSDFIPELTKKDERFSDVKKTFIDECSIRMTVEKRNGEVPEIKEYVAIAQKDRSNANVVDKEVTFMTTNNKTDSVDASHFIDVYNLIFPQNKKTGNSK